MGTAVIGLMAGMLALDVERTVQFGKLMMWDALSDENRKGWSPRLYKEEQRERARRRRQSFKRSRQKQVGK